MLKKRLPKGMDNVAQRSGALDKSWSARFNTDTYVSDLGVRPGFTGALRS